MKSCSSQNCINKNKECYRCSIIIKTKNYYKTYEPSCQFGFKDCIFDPAYIKYKDPNWYKEKYGNLTLHEAMKISCKECIKENGLYYDDEDK